MTNLGSFVVVKTEVRAQLDLIQSIQIKSQIDWRVVSRIAADDDQRIYFARIDVPNEFAQRLRLIDGIGFDGIGIEDRLADVAERVVKNMCQRVNARRLFITSYD